MTQYADAPEVRDIALDLIAQVDEYSVLGGVEVRYVWRDEAQISKGRVVLAKARKVGGLNAHLAGARDPALGLFVVEVAEDTWAHLDGDQRVALIDHELAHLDVGFDDDTKRMKLGIVGHDVEEFLSVARRHGHWRPENAAFAEAPGQQRFALHARRTDPDAHVTVTFGDEDAGRLRRAAADMVNAGVSDVSIDTDRIG